MRLYIESRSAVPEYSTLVHDFDHDGKSEILGTQVISEQDSNGWVKPSRTQVMVLSHDYHTVNQLNLPFVLYRSRAFAFDFDRNQEDELYLFSIENDSLFLWVLDPLKEPTILKKRLFCLYVGDNEFVKKGNHPDVYFNYNFITYNDDQDFDLVLYIQTGFGIQPRKFVVLDLKNEVQLFISKPMGFATKNFGFRDINNDGKNECILFQTHSPSNDGERINPFSDASTWAIIFSGDLSKILLKKEYPGVFSDSRFHIFSNNLFFITVSTYNAKKSSGLIQVLDKNLSPQKELILENSRVLSSGLYPEEKKPIGLWVLGSDGNIRIFDYNLVVKKTIDHADLVNPEISFETDLDLDGKNEFLFHTRNVASYGILSSDLKDSYTFETDDVLTQMLGKYAYLKLNGFKKSTLYFRTVNFQYELSYLPNPWYYPTFLFPLLAGFLVCWFIYNLFSYLISRRITLQISQDFRTYKPGLIGIFSSEGKLLYWYNQQPYWTGVQRFLEKPDNKNWVASLVKQNEQKTLSILHDFPDLASCSVSLIPVALFRSKLIVAWQMEINSTTRDQRLQLWSKVMQKMVHDLKTPLSSMSLNLRTLKMKLEESGLEKSLGQPELFLMESEIKRLRDQSRQFLRMVNLEPPKLSSVNLVFLIRQVCDRFSSFFNDGTELTLDLPAEPVYVDLDQAQWEFVFQTLIENSIDALNDGGTLHISLNSIHQLDQDFKPAVEIQVSDSGKGIPKENLDQIFEPYFTTKREGNGLGLAVVKKIIEDHSGQIRAESDPGKWTTFTILIPQTEPKVN
ncbi:MAG: HAMP domain-containing histidine kinase [Bacteroidetes bacterium]|nr:HAMP domain-containing histidine kinase [Bacteroidota bacterium]